MVVSLSIIYEDLSTDRTVIFSGIERGYYQVAGNLQTDLFAASSRGSGPVSKGIYYALLDFVAWVSHHHGVHDIPDV